MTTQAPSAFTHPRLTELLKAAGATPFVGQLLVTTLKDMVHPQDRILACYYHLETSVPTPEQPFSYYSMDVALVTTAFFIRIHFYPKTHTCVKKRIHAIADIKLEYPAPPLAALADLNGSDFVPARIALGAHFVNERGETVDTWQPESTDPQQVRQLLDIGRLLSRAVGMPLSQAAALAG